MMASNPGNSVASERSQTLRGTADGVAKRAPSAASRMPLRGLSARSVQQLRRSRQHRWEAALAWAV